jgi:prepilin-type N-terminal cleavage/methylation domain-containing protein
MRSRRSEGGFTLIELLIATFVLSTALLGLIGVMTLAVRHAGASSAMLVAREKAREAVESVHTARDTGALSWPMIRNAPDGVFVTGLQPLKTPGADGLVNTKDDQDEGIETLRAPGPDGELGNDDDQLTPLTEFTREIVITNLTLDGTTTVNQNLREITVNVRYRVQGFWRTYTLRTYVSSFS